MSDDGITIKLHGDRDLVDGFRELRAYVPKALAKSVREAAKIFLARILERVRIRTGRLLKNISIKIRRTKGTVRARVVVNTKGKEGDPQNAFYWRFLEKGFRTRDGRVIKYPFVEQPFEANKQQAAQQVVTEMDKALKRTERRVRRTLRQ